MARDGRVAAIAAQATMPTMEQVFVFCPKVGRELVEWKGRRRSRSELKFFFSGRRGVRFLRKKLVTGNDITGVYTGLLKREREQRMKTIGY